MKANKTLFIHCALFSCMAASASAIATEIGVDYGKQFLDNTNLAQYELHIREPLSFARQFESGLKVSSAVEIGMAIVKETESDNDPAGRFSAMPQMILSPHENINFFVGIGAGFMVGNTEFTDHNLGGAALVASKVGIQFLLGGHWGLGYTYYHQSNGGIYDYNASLNMHQLAFTYAF
jgi:hypothetical protein